jgi:hypothetical protein
MSFISDKEINFFKNIQEELMSNIRQQIIEYLTVENLEGYDEDENIYNEYTKEEIVFADPVEIKAYVLTNTPKMTYSEYGGKYKNSIEVKIHTDYLDAMKIAVVAGQYFRWGGNLYQILQETGREKQVWGQPDIQIYRNFKAVIK